MEFENVIEKLLENKGYVEVRVQKINNERHYTIKYTREVPIKINDVLLRCIEIRCHEGFTHDVSFCTEKGSYIFVKMEDIKTLEWY